MRSLRTSCGRALPVRTVLARGALPNIPFGRGLPRPNSRNPAATPQAPRVLFPEPRRKAAGSQRQIREISWPLRVLFPEPAARPPPLRDLSPPYYDSAAAVNGTVRRVAALAARRSVSVRKLRATADRPGLRFLREGGPSTRGAFPRPASRAPEAKREAPPPRPRGAHLPGEAARGRRVPRRPSRLGLLLAGGSPSPPWASPFSLSALVNCPPARRSLVAAAKAAHPPGPDAGRSPFRSAPLREVAPRLALPGTTPARRTICRSAAGRAATPPRAARGRGSVPRQQQRLVRRRPVLDRGGVASHVRAPQCLHALVRRRRAASSGRTGPSAG
jgi:hypothetical protein